MYAWTCFRNGCSFILKILSKIHILTLIKEVTLLQICTPKNIYNPSLDLVNDNVYTIFGLIMMSIKGRNSVTNLGINQGGYSVANVHTKKHLQSQLRSCQ